MRTRTSSISRIELEEFFPLIVPPRRNQKPRLSFLQRRFVHEHLSKLLLLRTKLILAKIADLVILHALERAKEKKKEKILGAFQ
jgi:hypothetical protein